MWAEVVKARQWIAAAACATGAVVLAIKGDVWPFNTTPPALTSTQKDPSIWQYLLGDRATLGFVRLGIVMLFLFVIASIPALVMAGRWLKGFGTSGLTADDAAKSNEALETLKTQVQELTDQLEQVTKERDEALKIAEESTRAMES